MHLDPPLQMIIDLVSQAAAPAPRSTRPTSRPFVPRPMRRCCCCAAPLAPGIEVADHTIEVSGGSIRVRTYRPDTIDQSAPAVLFIHGGGWMQGNLDTAEIESGPLAELVPCFVASVEYRLAPEHPFPTAIDDCLAAYHWLRDSSERFGLDPARIAVAGTSAGGNLAGALCIAARDAGLPLPCVQLLDIPALDLTLSSPSIHAVDTQAGLTGDDVARYAAQYLQGADATNPLASPLHAADLTGMPPAVIVVAEHDPVRDDGERYLQRLHESGVAAAAVRVLAHFHGGYFIPVTITSRLVLDLRVSALRRAFAGTLVPWLEGA